MLPLLFGVCSQQANGSKAPAPHDLAPEVTGSEEAKEQASAKKLRDEEKEEEEEMTPELMTALNKLGIDEAKDNRIFNPESSDKQKHRPSLLKSPSDYLPMIRRGFSSRFEEKEEEPVVSVGWQVEVRNRKEREEALRYVFLSFSKSAPELMLSSELNVYYYPFLRDTETTFIVLK